MNNTDVFLGDIDLFSKSLNKKSVREKVKILLLDYIGVTFAGVQFHKQKIDKLISEIENGSMKPIGIDKDIPLKEAVFYNGLNAHALDFDDGTNTGIIHLGSPIFSVLLPLAKKYGMSGKDFVNAAIIGYETSFTMAASIQPTHKEMGYHATGTCGTIGIAVAISYLLNYTKQQRRDTFAAACVSATGLLKVLEDGSELKPFNVAKTAVMGLIAAEMGRMGFQGPEDVLDGEKGFLKMMTGTENVVLQKPKLDGTYAVEKAYIKPYAACRYCHPAIEAAIVLREKYNIKDKDIKKIDVKTYFWAVNKHNHTHIKGIGSAKMSIPYGVAVGIVTGKAGLNEYDENHIVNDVILQLTEKVNVTSDKVLTELFPQKTVAHVSIHMFNGEIYEERVEVPKGEPENPITFQEVKEKFIMLSSIGGKDNKDINKIIDIIMQLEQKLSDLYNLL